MILFMGDGMSFPNIMASRVYNAQSKDLSFREALLSFEKFPFTGLSRVSNNFIRADQGLETIMGVEQRAVPGTNPRISRVVSKSDSDQGTASTAHRTLGLTPVGPICHSNLSLSHYPLLYKRRVF